MARSLPFLAWLPLAGLLAAGCGKKPADEQAGNNPPPQVAPAPATPATPPAAGTAEHTPVVGHEAQHMSFADATRKDAPEGMRPPDTTLTKKSTAQLFEQVVKSWDTIKFVNPEGKKLAYTAVVKTAMGTVEIELKPEWAPNHVRNFIALAKAGYYDGLCFDRILQDESDVEQGTQFMEIEAGCALGTGQPGADSIGYWLLPESHAEAKHEVGSVGACRGVEKDTAACKFYVSLCKAQYLDVHYTVFGKVTQGLDVARKIFLQPTVIHEDDPDGSRRPVKPVTIESVTIVSKEVAP